MVPSRSAPRIVILGAGPTGLGAAYRLHELGHQNFLVLEKNPYPGGLAASFADEKGFTWDIGGHVQFSHYEYFDQVMDRAVGDAWVHHTRQSHIWICGCFIPYPFQNNLKYLPKEELVRCVRGLLRTFRDGRKDPANFREWILATFGEGVAELFLFPYNWKVWAHPLEMLSHRWVGERVAVVDVERVVENVILDRDDAAWGPNYTFRFPLRGGTGAIWAAVAREIPQARIRYEAEAVRIDPGRRVVQISTGEEVTYDVLISSLPLDVLARLASRERWVRAARRLKFTTTHVVGVGVRGRVPSELRTKNWMYLPEGDCPFYRVTVFSNYSPNNVPIPGDYWSLLAEVSESEFKPVDRDRLLEEVVLGLRSTGLLPSGAEVVSLWVFTAPHGYPVPTVDRDSILDELLPALEREGIYSRGRFGAWKYEVGNQDHSFMQGVEVVDSILFRRPETTVIRPDEVTGGVKLPCPSGRTVTD
jgi:protoporphyrinogen oxidase